MPRVNPLFPFRLIDTHSTEFMIILPSQLTKAINPRVISLILGLLCFCFLISCDEKSSGYNITPRAVKGVMDLQNWDFEKNDPLKLDGEWEFYWERLLLPGDFLQAAHNVKTDYIKVPQIWNGHQVDGKTLDGDGFATFRLKIKVNPASDFYAIKFVDCATAYTLWLNGKIVLKSGIVGKSREEMKPQYYPQTSVIRLSPGENILIIQVSNFHHKKGGLWGSVLLGTEQSISRLRERILSFEIFLFGALLIIGAYHLGIYFMRKKEKTALLFSLVSFTIALREICTGERILILMFPDFNWQLFQKIEYLTVYISAPLFFLYLRSLFSEFSVFMEKFAIYVGTAFVLFTIVTPARLFSHTIQTYQGLIILYGVYILITLIRIVMKKRAAAYWVFVGIILLLSAVFHDILTANDVIDNVQLSPLGFFLFIFLQSIMLSQKLTKSFSNVEQVHEDLEESYKAKDELVSALTESEKKYRELVENIDEVLFTLDLKGRITYVSPSVESITGFTPDNLLRLMGSELIYHEDQLDAQQCFKKTMEGYEQHLTCRVTTKWDSTRWVRFNLRPLMEGSKVKGIQGLVADITEHKKARELMVQTEKMMSVGGLAAGMAHEINNPLGAMMQAAQIVKRRLFSDQGVNKEKAAEYSINLAQLSKYLTKQKVLHFLDGILDAGNRAANIISNMLQFSRKSDAKMKLVNLEELVDQTIQLANNSYDLEKEIDFKRIRTIKEFDDSIHRAYCSETEIRQVILNLLINAAQALLTDRIPKRPEITIRIKEEGEFARIEVEDNGPGMDEATRGRIFEPFFTTKPVGKGTGLGLSVSYMIITNNHSGAFEVESELGKGTRFIIWLPKEKQLVKG